jgi:hypothetical protein
MRNIKEESDCLREREQLQVRPRFLAAEGSGISGVGLWRRNS